MVLNFKSIFNATWDYLCEDYIGETVQNTKTMWWEHSNPGCMPESAKCIIKNVD